MDWLTVLFGSTTFISAAGAVWVWVTQSYIPARLKERERRELAADAASADERDFLQETQGDALKTVLSVNDKLINHLLSLSNGKFDEMLRVQTTLNRRMERLEDMMRITTQDWSNIDEILSDIDVTMQNINSRLSPQETSSDTGKVKNHE